MQDAVTTYLFNSQLLSRDDGSMMLVLPQECREHTGVWRYLNRLLEEDNPIDDLRVFDLRESMSNGGGPACLRLRVVLTLQEQQAVNPAVIMNDMLFNTLNNWVDRYYRDRLTAADLADPQLLREGREALDTLTQLLNLGSVYPFQLEGCAMDNFLAITLAGATPEETQGTIHGFDWQWIGHGILELTPLAPVEHSLVLSAGIMAMKPRR